MNLISAMKFVSSSGGFTVSSSLSFSSLSPSIFNAISEHLKRKFYWTPPCSATRAVKSAQNRIIDKFLIFTVDLKLNRLL
jgi:hypothetical protein